MLLNYIVNHQFIILQNLIKPEHIVRIENISWNIWELNEHFNRQYSRKLGLKLGIKFGSK